MNKFASSGVFLRPLWALAFIVSLLALAPLSAEILTFDRDGDSSNGVTDASGGTWNTTNTNWFSSTGTANVAWPNTDADTAIFGGGGVTSSTVFTVATAGNLTVNKIIFNYANPNGTYTLNGSGQLLFSGTTPTVTVNSNTATINARMTATSLVKDGAGLLIINNSQNNLGALTLNAGSFDIFSTLVTTDVVVNGSARISTHSGTVFSMDSLTYDSTGSSSFVCLGNNGTSTYSIGSGGLTMSAGNLTVSAGTNSASNAKSTLTITGPLRMSGGTLAITTSNTAGNEPAAAKVVLKNNVTATGNATISSGGLGTETLDLDGATRTFTVDTGATLTLSAVTANGGIQKDGVGILRLSGSDANTYTGMTTLNNGTLSLAKTASVTAVQGDITITGGLLDWDSSHQLNDSSSIYLNGGALKIDGFTETFANLYQTAGTINSAGGSNNGFITVTGVFSATGGSLINLNSGAQWSVGALSLAASYNPGGNDFGLNGNSSRLTLFTVGSGGLTINGHTFSLEKSAAATTNGLGSELALNGDVTATGTNLFTFNTSNTNGGSNINLGSGIRTWNIISGTTSSNSSLVSLSPGDGATTPVRTVVEGGLTKTGAGTLVLNASNTYTGKTTVNQGILRIATASGGITDSYWLQVNSAGTFDNSTGSTYTHDGTLSGTGTLSGNFRVGDNMGAVMDTGILRPGASSNDALESTAGDLIGTLTFTGNLELAAPAASATTRAALQIVSPTGNAASSYSGGSVSDWVADIETNHAALVTGGVGNHDQVSVTGTLTLNADGRIVVTELGSSYIPIFGDVFNLFDWGTLTENTFNVGTNNRTGGSGGGDLDLPDISAYPGYVWDVSQFLNTGIVVVVPEPSRLLLLSAGLMLGLLRRRRGR